MKQSALCTAAIAKVEQRHQTPPGLLLAISRVESGRPVEDKPGLQPWPWTIDADGQGYFFDSKAAAVAWAALAEKRGVGSMDVGCMQINLQFHPDAFRTLSEAFDPAANVAYAARFLAELHAGPANGDWSVAVGMYHSRTPILAALYRNQVAAVGAGIVSGVAGEEALYTRSLRRGTLHMALAGGGMLFINLNRQPARRARPRMSPCQVAAVLGPYLRSPPRGHACRKR